MLCTVCSGSIFYCIFKSLNKTKRKLAFLNLGSEVIMNFNKTFDWTEKKKIKRQFKFSCPEFQRLIVKFSNKSFYDDIFCKMNLILKSLFLKLFIIASSLHLRQSSIHCLIWGKSAIWVYVFLPAYIQNLCCLWEKLYICIVVNCGWPYIEFVKKIINVITNTNSYENIEKQYLLL